MPCLLLLLGLSRAAHADSLAEREFHAVIHLQPNISHGEELFDTCSACHGRAGSGVSDGTVPVIAAQHFRVIAWELVSFRNNERRDPRMQHFTDEHHLSGAQDIADVAAYVSRLQPVRSPDHGDGEYVAKGDGIYRAHCASCHGAKAEGNDPKRYPRLAGQHYEYLMRQLRDSTAERRPNMVPDHSHLLEGFMPAELIGVCDYLSRLGPSIPTGAR
jgi:cytochrome c553